MYNLCTKLKRTVMRVTRQVLTLCMMLFFSMQGLLSMTPENNKEHLLHAVDESWNDVTSIPYVAIDKSATNELAPSLFSEKENRSTLSPSNDHFSNAISLNIGAVSVLNNIDATVESGETDPNSNSSCPAAPGDAKTVWFTFVAPSSRVVKISTDIATTDTPGALLDTELTLYKDGDGWLPTACASGGGTLIAENAVLQVGGLEAGATYYIQVHGKDGAEGTFGIEVKALPPSNDNFVNNTALTIGASSWSTAYTNVDATVESGETDPNSNSSCPAAPGDAKTVWFTFVAPNSGAVEISTDIGPSGIPGALIDTELILYKAGDGWLPTACASGGGTEIAENAVLDATGLDVGATYYIQVFGKDGAEGTFGIEVKVLNDIFNNAIALTIGTPSTQTAYTNVNTTTESGEPANPDCLSSTVQKTVWFTFVAPSSGAVEISTDIGAPGTIGALTDTELLLYRKIDTALATTTTNLTRIACEADGGTTIANNAVLNATGLEDGATYYIQVFGNNGAEGIFGIKVKERPINDELSRAIPLTIGTPSTQTAYTNVNTTTESGEPTNSDCLSGSTVQKTVWFTFVAPSAGLITINTDIGASGTPGALTDTELILYKDDDGWTPTACASGGGTTIANNAVLNATGLEAGTTYYIQVFGKGGAEGTFGIEVKILNDNFSNATVLTVGTPSEQTAYSNVGATVESGEIYANGSGCPNLSGYAKTVWFRFAAPISGVVEISTDIGASDTPGALTDTELRFDKDFSGWLPGTCASGGGITITNNAVLRVGDLVAEATYYIQVFGKDGAEGAFGIEVNAINNSPSNNSRNSAIALTLGEASLQTDYTNVHATLETGETYPNSNSSCKAVPNTAKTVWFSFVAPSSGIVEISTDIGASDTPGALLDTELLLYREDDEFLPVDCASGGGTTIANNVVLRPILLISGFTYYIQVFGKDGAEGAFGIEVREKDNLLLSPKIFLQGAYDSISNSMRDDLREANIIPTATPYSDGATVNASVFSTTGNDAIVDWVYVELRDKNDISTVVAGTSALLQRDGDVVALDGIANLSITAFDDDYYVVINHRNHIAIATDTLKSLSTTNTVIDLTSDLSKIRGGVNAVKKFSSTDTDVYALFAGDAVLNSSIDTNDITTVKGAVGFIGYSLKDINMNGDVQTTDLTLISKLIGKIRQF